MDPDGIVEALAFLVAGVIGKMAVGTIENGGKPRPAVFFTPLLEPLL